MGNMIDTRPQPGASGRELVSEASLGSPVCLIASMVLACANRKAALFNSMEQMLASLPDGIWIFIVE